MTAEEVIELIRKLSADDQQKVQDAFLDLVAESDADIMSARRIQELRQGKVAPLSQEEIIGAARAESR